MDVSSANFCLPQDLLTDKLENTVLTEMVQILLMDYIDSRKQKKKVVASHSNWSEIKRGIFCHRKVKALYIC